MRDIACSAISPRRSARRCYHFWRRSQLTDTNLTIAIDLYDRHLPLFMGQVAPPDALDLTFLEVGMAPPRRHGIDRHKRMLVDR